MQYQIITSLTACLSENGFSIDELVCRMKALFETNAYGELLKQILLLVEENLRLRIMQGYDMPVVCQCGGRKFVLNGTQARQLMTGLGEISLTHTSRVKCRQCATTFSLLMRFLKVSAYQSKSMELEKLVLEEVAGDTYRRAHQSIRKMTGVNRAHSTYHNWVVRTDADEIKVPEGVIGSVPGEVFADGTKCKAADGSKGDIKVMIGVNGNGDTYPIGTWTHHETWETISKEIDERKIVFPHGTMLVSDGEPGLADALARHAENHQRCHWHIIRDTYHAMWEDGGKKEASQPIQDALKVILAVELPQAEFQKVSESEKDEIEAQMEGAEAKVDQLIAHLRGKGYGKVADYLQRSRNYMFSYVRRWLQFGISCPRASSLIERTMRELGRRVKKIAYNWKSDGLGKVVRIVLKIFSHKEEWEKYWAERMFIAQNVSLTFKIIKS